MRILVFLVGIFGALAANAQSRMFRTEAPKILKATDSVYVIDEQSASEAQYDFTVEGVEPLETIFLGAMKEDARKKPDELQQSATLTSLAILATKCWRGKQYEDRKKWGKLAKYFKRASYLTSSKYNIIKEVSFRMDMMNSRYRRYYYDAKGSEGGLNLYYGTKPRSKQEREETNQIPLDFRSEEELKKEFIKMLKRRHVYNDLKRGNYDFVGIRVEIDENSLNRSKMPTSRVVVILGARRLKNVKVRYRKDEDN